MRGPRRVIILDDSASNAETIVGVLEKAGWTATTVRIGDEAAMRDALARGAWDLVISDSSARPFAAPPALEVLREKGQDLPFIIVSRTVGESGGVEGLRADAQVHLLKPEAAGFGAAIARVLRDAKSRGAQQRAETALHRTEEQLRQAQRAESMGNLAAGVAHHFNNVLSVVLGHGDLILAELSPADPLYAAIEQMRSAGQSAADLTRQLLAFSQRQFLQPRVVDLNQIVAGLERMVRKVVGEHIDLIILPGTDLGLVNVDPVQMEQVIMSLAINARDAMPDGGQLTLETANTTLDASSSARHPGTRPGPHVALSFTDTGVGLTPEVRARIFEPYFMSKTPEWGGSLGLGTALGIVEQSGGSIFVTGEAGQGTTFKVCLPQADREDAVPGAPPPRRRSDFRGDETILLVEDDERVRLTGWSEGHAAQDGVPGSRGLERRRGRADLRATIGEHRSAPHRRGHAADERSKAGGAGGSDQSRDQSPLHVGIRRRFRFSAGCSRSRHGVSPKADPAGDAGAKGP